jgi:UDP-GlcNAc:undecaprenyl-phosphate/decaprenyl-phosphate GlcNAc-1-phosphate transferase
MLILYASIFVLSSLLSLLTTRFVRDTAHRNGWLEPPRLDRHVHTVPIPRIGGVAIFSSFVIAILAFLMTEKWLGAFTVLPMKPVITLFVPVFLIFLLGLYDDLRGVSPYWKVLVQAFAATLLFLGGYGINHLTLVSNHSTLQSFIGLPLTVLWVLLITNAFNLIDGLDGLAAGSAFFSTAIVFILSILTPNPMISCLSLGLAGSILGFLRFNFNPASIFLGDSGSLFIGFMLSELALVGSQKAPTMVAVAIPIVALGLPILDVCLAVARRFVRSKHLFAADSDHIHHKLLKRGLSQREAVLVLYAVTAGFGFVSLLLLRQRSIIAFVLAVTGVAVLVGVQQLRYGEFDEMLSLMQRATHRRKIVANHVAVRRASELLNNCSDFQAICGILKEALQPVGFDGIRFQMLHPNGYAASAFFPMSYEPDGRLFCTWSDSEIAHPNWELTLELLSTTQQRWGYVSLIRLSCGKAIALDMNVLSQEFRTSISQAVHKACAVLDQQAEHDRQDPQSPHHNFSAASGSSD